jgi:hypothetical protein
MGGVWATCAGADGAAGAWAEAVKDARARAARESKARIRMMDPLGNDFWRILFR